MVTENKITFEHFKCSKHLRETSFPKKVLGKK